MGSGWMQRRLLTKSSSDSLGRPVTSRSRNARQPKKNSPLRPPKTWSPAESSSRRLITKWRSRIITNGGVTSKVRTGVTHSDHRAISRAKKHVLSFRSLTQTRKRSEEHTSELQSRRDL